MTLTHIRPGLAVLLALAMAGAPLAAQAPRTPAPAASKFMDGLQGAWLITVADGQDLAGSGQEIVITITGNAYVQTINGEVVERGTFKVDETKKPITLDLAITEGQDAGQTQVGVLQVDGKTMYGKVADAGGTARPTDFAPADGFFTFTATKR